MFAQSISADSPSPPPSVLKASPLTRLILVFFIWILKLIYLFDLGSSGSSYRFHQHFINSSKFKQNDWF
jgi:hypothetical protein